MSEAQLKDINILIRPHPKTLSRIRHREPKRIKAAVAVAEVRVRLSEMPSRPAAKPSQHRALDRLLPMPIDPTTRPSLAGPPMRLCYRTGSGEIGGLINPKSILAKPPFCPRKWAVLWLCRGANAGVATRESLQRSSLGAGDVKRL